MPSKVGAKPWRTICRWLSTWRIFAARVVALVVHLQLWMLWRMVGVGLHRLQFALKLQLHHLLQMLFSLLPLFQLQKLVQMQVLHLLLFLLQRLRWQSYHRLHHLCRCCVCHLCHLHRHVLVVLVRCLWLQQFQVRWICLGLWGLLHLLGAHLALVGGLLIELEEMHGKVGGWTWSAWFGMIWHDLAWFDMIWHDLTWFGMAWLGMIVACPCHWLLIGTCQVDTQSNIRRRPQEPFASCFGCFFF